jgi:glycosyltransferase involved in cell wall biosynthesis
MNDYLAIILPSLKIGGGNRVLLQFLELAKRDNKKCKLFYLNRKGGKFLMPSVENISQSVINDSLFAILLASLILSFRIRFDSSIKTIVISDPVLSIFSFIYSRNKVVRFVQSNDLELFNKNTKGGGFANFIYKIIFKFTQKYRYHAVIFNSQYSLVAYNKTLPANKFFSSSSIVNPPVFTINYNKNNISQISSPINISIVTSSQPRKGLSKFIEIVNKSKLENINYFVISQDKLNLPNKNIILKNPESDMEYVKILQKCHFALSTSTFEGFGLPLIEAMALGIIPIAIYNKGMDEYYNKKNITIIKSVEDFDIQITNIITNNDKYIKLSNEAINTASLFTEQKFYSSIIKKIQ